MFTSKRSFELSSEWYFLYLVNSCRYHTAISIDVLRMSVLDKNLAKCTLLIQRSLHALIDYHKMLFLPHFIHQTKHAREKVEMILKAQSISKYFVMKGTQNISGLHTIICSIVSLFLWYIMKIVVSSVFNHISPSFVWTNFILKRKHKI